MGQVKGQGLDIQRNPCGEAEVRGLGFITERVDSMGLSNNTVSLCLSIRLLGRHSGAKKPQGHLANEVSIVHKTVRQLVVQWLHFTVVTAISIYI